MVFREELFIRRAPAGWTLFLAGSTATVTGMWWWIRSGWGLLVVLLGCALVVGAALAGTATTITATAITLWRRPLRRPRRIPLADVVSAEVVIGDSNTSTSAGGRGRAAATWAR